MKNIADKTVHFFLQKLGDLNNKKIAIGYSAGADSTALLHILSKKSKHFGFHLEAVFFTHKNSPITEGEDKNLILAKHTCENLGIPLKEEIITMNKTSKKSWEQIGREGRLNFYKNNSYDFVFLGHHLDDQNENTMIQLFRGGGKGITGMNEKETFYCRPFLNISKKEIYEFLIENNLQWIEDPTNTNTYFTRNFWRNEILPKIETHYPNYSQTLSKFREKQKSLQKIAYDMAIIDGLDSFISNNQVNIKNLNPYRIENLITQSFKVIGASLENNQISNLIKIWEATGFSEIKIGNKNIVLSKDNISLNLIHSIKNNKI